MQFDYQGRTYKLLRYPTTTNRSLQAWQASDELLLAFAEEADITPGHLGIWHDRFGVLGTLLHAYTPQHIISYHSQQVALHKQLTRNHLPVVENQAISVVEGLKIPLTHALIRIPKSLDLFEYYLHQVSESLAPSGEAAAGFMTRHFSPELIKRAEKYFGRVSQSRARKKARILQLSGPKQDVPPPAFKEIELRDGTVLQQYPGVFSARHIDPATQLLLDHFELQGNVQRILDLGTGNGIIGKKVQERLPEVELHLVDDFHLAAASARLNVHGDRVHIHTTDSLATFEGGIFDLVLSNPPFHIEHENNIEVSLRLFTEVARCLCKGGHFQLVANRHLNYMTHLQPRFRQVEVMAENERFVVYDCWKG